MAGHQGDLALLNDPIAQALLQSTIPARLAYSWTDGTPRVVPIWFHLGCGADHRRERLAPKVLLVRGSASVQLLDDVSPEYAAAATRYFLGLAALFRVARMADSGRRALNTPTVDCDLHGLLACRSVRAPAAT
jgi:hypothetical protein